MTSLIGTELLAVIPIGPTGQPGPFTEQVTTAQIAALGGGGGGTPGGSNAQVQYNSSGTFAGTSNATVNSDGTLNILPEVVNISGTTKTLALTDANSIQDCTNSSALTVTIPTNASVAFPVNTAIAFEQNGAGTLTITAASGAVTLNGIAGGSITVGGQYTGCYIRQESANAWYLEGGSGNLSGDVVSVAGVTTLQNNVTARANLGVSAVGGTYLGDTTTTAQTITLIAYAPYAFTISSLKNLATNGGTVTGTLNINGVPVTGCSSLSLSTSPQNATATATNVVSVGGTVTFVTTSPTSLTGLAAFSLTGTR